jgi:hypothetical protein
MSEFGRLGQPAEIAAVVADAAQISNAVLAITETQPDRALLDDLGEPR